MTPHLKLRSATLADVPTLRVWDRDPAVLAAGGGWESDDFNWTTEIPRSVLWREFLIAELDGRPIGFIQIIDPQYEDSNYWGDIAGGFRAIDIWIGGAADRGQGHGTAMMRLALDRCFADPTVTAVLIDPLTRNTAAHRFYERLGFRPTGQRWFDDDDCTIYRLNRGTHKV